MISREERNILQENLMEFMERNFGSMTMPEEFPDEDPEFEVVFDQDDKEGK